MNKPCIPNNESERLAEVYKLNILDSPREVCFENITSLVHKVFKVKVAAISVIDDKRQWFKSIRGANIKETPRELSFCAHAINHSKIFVINDTFKDENFNDHPLVQGSPNIRFYAGCTLYTRNGFALGALCIIDDKPREFSQEQMETLLQFARLVETYLYKHGIYSVDKIPDQYQLNLENFNSQEKENHIFSKKSFISFFNQLRHNCALARKNDLLPYSNFYLTVLEISPLDELYERLPNDMKLSLSEEIIEVITKNLHGDDILANLDADKFIIVLDSINQNMLEIVISNIKHDVENIDVAKYGCINKSLNIKYGVAHFDKLRQVPTKGLIERACSDMKKKFS